MSSCCSPLTRQSVNPMSPWELDNKPLHTSFYHLVVSSFWKMICPPIEQLQIASMITNEEGSRLLKGGNYQFILQATKININKQYLIPHICNNRSFNAQICFQKNTPSKSWEWSHCTRLSMGRRPVPTRPPDRTDLPTPPAFPGLQAIVQPQRLLVTTQKNLRAWRNHGFFNLHHHYGGTFPMAFKCLGCSVVLISVTEYTDKASVAEKNLIFSWIQNWPCKTWHGKA